MQINALVMCLLLVWPAFATSETVIYAISIPGLHEPSGDGMYDKIIEAGLAGSTIKVLPPARAEKSFKTCVNCCLSPANKNPDFYDFGDDIVVTDAMSVAKIYIFSPKSGKTYSTLDEIKDKTVGIRDGMPHGKSFAAANLKTVSVSKNENNIMKLDSKRIDVMVAYVPDAYDSFKSMGIDPYPHNKEAPISIHPDALVCRGVPDELILKFNNYLKTVN